MKLINSANALAGLRQAAHLLIENNLDNGVDVSSSAQVVHALRFRADSGHGGNDQLKSGEIFSAVHG